MRKVDARGAEIFYSLHMCEDLFSGWSVVREWGRSGSGGHVKISLVPSEESALSKIQSTVASNMRRGYDLIDAAG
jgi:predicted DNA-binding WGR domain protein